MDQQSFNGLLQAIKVMKDKQPDFNPNACATSGESLLEHAASQGDPACVRLILARGAEPDLHTAGDSDGRRGNRAAPLSHAAYLGHLSCVQLLRIHGANPRLASHGFTAAMYAETYGWTAVWSFLIVSADWPAIKIAVALRSPADARIALKFGNIDTEGCALQDLLHVALSTSPFQKGDDDDDDDDDEACAATISFVHAVMAPWSPRTHPLYHTTFRSRIRTVLLVGARLGNHWRCRKSARRTPPLPPLPPLMWKLVGSFLARRDWPACTTSVA